MKRFIISKKVSLHNFLRDQFPNISARKLKKAIEANFCRVNKRVERFATFLLNPKDEVLFDTSSLDELLVKKIHLESARILFEDEALFFYNKPVGVASDEAGLSTLFSNYFLAHRLDKETSGVIVFAKSKLARGYLSQAFKKKQIGKVYLALVDGSVLKKKGVIENYLGRVGKKTLEPLFGVVPKQKGRYAKTAWKCIFASEFASLLKCFPETGRTHQIRSHLNHIGHPIIGDYRYSRQFQSAYYAKRCLLHAHKLALKHPLTQQSFTVEAPLPADFLEALRSLFENHVIPAVE